MSIEQAVWDHSLFSKNRNRLLAHEVVEALFTEITSPTEKRGVALVRTGAPKRNPLLEVFGAQPRAAIPRSARLFAVISARRSDQLQERKQRT